MSNNNHDIIYYSVSLLLDEMKHHFIWFTNESDGVLTKEKEKIESFKTIEELNQFAKKKSISLQLDETVCDVDAVINYFNKPDFISLYANEILDFWNLCLDISTSINKSSKKFRELDEQTSDIYSKIFSITEASDIVLGKNKTIETLDDKEILILKSLLAEGIQMIRSVL